MNRKFDRDVWRPPTGDRTNAKPTTAPDAPLSAFQLHFQNRMALVGRHGKVTKLQDPIEVPLSPHTRSPPERVLVDEKPARAETPHAASDAALRRFSKKLKGLLEVNPTETGPRGGPGGNAREPRKASTPMGRTPSPQRGPDRPKATEKIAKAVKKKVEAAEKGAKGAEKKVEAAEKGAKGAEKKVDASEKGGKGAEKGAGTGGHVKPARPSSLWSSEGLSSGGPDGRAASSRLSATIVAAPPPPFRFPSLTADGEGVEKERKNPKEKEKEKEKVREEHQVKAWRGGERAGVLPPLPRDGRAASASSGAPQIPREARKLEGKPPFSSSPSLLSSSGDIRRGWSYTPHTLDSYRRLLAQWAEMGKGGRGLGPSDTDAQREARTRKERERAYGLQVERQAMREAGGDGKHHAKGTAPPPPPPPSQQILLARERRRKALAYAREVEEQKRQQQLQARIEAETRERAESEATTHEASVSPSEVSEREHHLMNMLLVHEKNKMAVESIRRIYENGY